MKDLSIEEKAKRYDDLLVKLQKAKVDNDVCDERYCCVIDDIVPELKESEDERIRKAIVLFFELQDDNTTYSFIPKKDILSWLEKHKYTEEDLDKAYKCADEVQYRRGYEDAKKEIEEQGKNNMGISEATKQELEDNLNKALEKETGESWNEFLDEQKSAWSKEDEIALCDALWCCRQAASIAKDENDMGNAWYAERWLKSLKRKVYTWKPSDEQMKAVDIASECVYAEEDIKALKLLYQDLKKLKGERVKRTF